MAGWAGFSDEELRRLQQKDQAVPAALGRTRKPAQANRNRQQRERALRVAAQQDVVPGAPALTPGQQLSKGPPEHRPPPPPAPPAEKIKEGDPSVNHQIPRAEEPLPIVKELEKQEVEIREKTRLELLQQEQKMIEERNKRKKALLTKTIAEKSKQTQEEAVKLKRIQKELQVLDDMVSNDIGILRCRIEQASWDYSAARKRYEKAETEYVTAKLDLHKKTEIKEQLTEHLCAIIQQNELRKAHKLEELMQQLQLQVTEEELDGARQRMEEEEKEKAEEKKRRDILEDGEEGTEVRENGEAAVPSTRDRPSTAGENVKDQTAPPAPETKGTTKDCDVVENTPQNQAVTFVS